MRVDYTVSRAYTYQGGLPEELPDSWKASNGERYNLREMPDDELEKLGWFPVNPIPSHNPDIQEVVWDKGLKKYRLDYKRDGSVYKAFWNHLITSGAYATLKKAASRNLRTNTICTEFIALLADAKFGDPNVEAIQSSLNEVLSSISFSVEEVAEIKSLFKVTGLSDIYEIDVKSAT